MRLCDFLTSCGVFYRFQLGFRPGDSAVMHLICIVNTIYKALEEGLKVRAVFLDVSKAFDKVWHRGLLAELESLRITGCLLLWFRGYLSDGVQRVTIDGIRSDWGKVEAGVLQGSVLGPLLFLVCINDIVDSISSDFVLFADDSLFIDEVISPTF